MDKLKKLDTNEEIENGITYDNFFVRVSAGVSSGFVGAIGGGGGIVSLPGYYLAGVPIHHAIATNKLSSATGTLISTIRIGKSVKIRWKLIAPAVVMALIGSYLGTRLSILTDEKILRQVLLIVLPVVAFFVPRKNSLISEKTERLEAKKEQLIVWTSALIIGTYDGFYGPGTGTISTDIVMGLAHLTSWSRLPIRRF